MAFLPNVKALLKINPAIRAGDFIKDVIDPKTDVFKNVDFPFNNGSNKGGASQARNTGKGSSGGGGATTETQYNPSNGGYGSGGSGNSGASAADLALIESGINQANSSLGMLGQQEQVGMENVRNSYNSNLNRLLGNKAIATRNYETNKKQTIDDNIEARNDIKTSVGRNANAAKRMLGARGSGDSSAAKIVAPHGAALEGTKQLRGVTDAFTDNMSALETSMGDFNKEFEFSKEDLERQKFQSENQVKADVATKRQSLLSNLATLLAQKVVAQGGDGAAAIAAARPQIDQANALNADITNLGRQYANPINIKAPEYAAPDLAQYDYDTKATPQIANTSAYTDVLNPALSILLGRRKQNNPLAV